MITIYNSDLTDDTIKVINNLLDKDISPKIAFHLLKITTTLQNIVRDKNKIYNKILSKYAIPSETPNEMTVVKENMELFQKDMNELMEIKHELDIEKINIEELGLESNIKVKDLYTLLFMFEIDLPEIKSYPSSSSSSSDSTTEK